LKTTRLDIIHDCSKAEHEPIKIYNVTVVSVYTVEWGFAVHDVGLEGEVVVEMKNNYGYLSAVDYPFWQVYYVKGRQTCDKQMMTDTATDKQTSVWLHGEAVRQTNQ
jgi:hypothetical protein